MNAAFYHPLYFLIIAIFCLTISFRYMLSSSSTLQIERYKDYLPLALSIFLIFWLGSRPISGTYFGDTINYAYEYNSLDVSERISISLNAEWLWNFLMILCKSSGFSVSTFFTIIEAGYILLAFWAIKRFVPSNPMVGMMFVLSSLMFYNFGINGLRNGLACSVIMLAISYFLDDKYWIAGILAFMAMSIHRSIVLPIICIILGRYFLKNYRVVLYFWIGCIIVSLLAGDYFSELFSSLGFDERMSDYHNAAHSLSEKNKGFRWDFLLYSAPPIFFAWYIIVIRGIKDDWYKTLSIAYCLANAFWVLIIRISFSNRFAYLSWFLYPILIVYPLINLPIWRDQDRKIGLVLGAYCCFTLVMQMIVW